MAKKCSSVLRQHFVLLVEDMPLFSTAAIATIVENGDRDASLDIILVHTQARTIFNWELDIVDFNCSKYFQNT